MLLEFSCSNHKSIRDKIVFSAVASKDTEHSEALIDFNDYQILKNAVIYGANGSGKSNFIDAISFMKFLVTQSVNFQLGDVIRQMPHKLSGLDFKSEYKIQFVSRGKRYAYGFALRNSLVEEEYLYYYPNGRATKIFEREGNDYTSGSKFNKCFDTCKDVLKPNKLFLSCAANFSRVEEAEDAFRFFKDDILVYRGPGTDDWMMDSLVKMSQFPALKKAVILFVQGLGTGIKDIKIKMNEENVPLKGLPDFLSDDVRLLLAQTPAQRIEAKVVYDAFETDLLNEESDGIKKLFELICPIIDVLSGGKILICDEIEANLHESIVYNLVQLFQNLKTEKTAQMFFTTHDTSILDLSLFRRDQIWFTELNGNTRATDLYSLAEIKNVRKDENVGKGYITGKYGAIPMLNRNLAQDILNVFKGDDLKNESK